MKQFIPAWYDSNNWWDSAVVPFYIKRKTTEFDDMVSLMLMHHKTMNHSIQSSQRMAHL